MRSKFLKNFFYRDNFFSRWPISNLTLVAEDTLKFNILFKVILGQTLREGSEYGNLKLNSLHRDHSPG